MQKAVQPEIAARRLLPAMPDRLQHLSLVSPLLLTDSGKSEGDHAGRKLYIWHFS